MTVQMKTVPYKIQLSTMWVTVITYQVKKVKQAFISSIFSPMLAKFTERKKLLLLQFNFKLMICKEY